MSHTMDPQTTSTRSGWWICRDRRLACGRHLGRGRGGRAKRDGTDSHALGHGGHQPGPTRGTGPRFDCHPTWLGDDLLSIRSNCPPSGSTGIRSPTRNTWPLPKPRAMPDRRGGRSGAGFFPWSLRNIRSQVSADKMHWRTPSGSASDCPVARSGKWPWGARMGPCTPGVRSGRGRCNSAAKTASSGSCPGRTGRQRLRTLCDGRRGFRRSDAGMGRRRATGVTACSFSC